MTSLVQENVAERQAPRAESGTSTGIDLAEVRAIVGTVADAIGTPASRASAAEIRSVSDAQAVLEASRAAVTAQLTGGEVSSAEQFRLLPVLDHVRHAQVLLEATISERRAQAVNYVRVAIDNLRQIGSVAELVSRAPIEAARLGFERCLLSKVSDSRWITRSAFVSGDRELADAMIDIGNRTSRVIDSRLIECELVRQRRSLLVRDAMHNDRVHPELVRLVKPEAYVVAPIIARGSVVGFIHADSGPDRNPVDEFDRDLLDTFSTGLSITLESLYYREQLDRIRQHMEGLGSLSSCLLGDGDDEADSDGATTRMLPPAARSLLQTAGGLLERLTRREVEVLTHMANGETNRRIAARLFVSEATVKAHVKHILRKLDAANRAEAVSRYFRAS